MIKSWSFSMKAPCHTYLTPRDQQCFTTSTVKKKKENGPEALPVGAAFLGTGTQSLMP